MRFLLIVILLYGCQTATKVKQEQVTFTQDDVSICIEQVITEIEKISVPVYAEMFVEVLKQWPSILYPYSVLEAQ